MPYVDPWGGTVQGLKTLGDTFDTLEERRRQRENDALDMPYKRLRNEEAEVKLRTLRELDAENRANREARKAEEASLATATKETDVTNPDYQPPAPVTPLSAIKARARETAALGVDTGIPQEVSVGSLPTLPQAAVPGVGLPTMSGQRPMTDAEKNHARLQSAFARGDMDAVSKLGNFIDVSDKIDAQGAAKIKQVMDAIKSVRETMGPAVALSEAKRMAAGMGMPPEVVSQIVMSPQGIISWPDGQGGTIAIFPDPTGKYHVVHSAAKEPKSPTQVDLELSAAKGDPLAIKTLAEQEARKLKLAKERKISSSGGLSFADKEALRSMGKQLPKSKIAAETAAKNLQKIDRMIALINKGAGGIRGELLSKINKVVDVFKVTSPEDAKYNTLKAELRGFAGQLRLQLGMIGQTSDRDVTIMYEAAGGMSPAESQRAIIEGYRQGYQQDVDNYNSDAEAYSGYSEAGRKLYRPVKVPSQETITVVERRKTKDGKTLEKLSDGTIREAK